MAREAENKQKFAAKDFKSSYLTPPILVNSHSFTLSGCLNVIGPYPCLCFSYYSQEQLRPLLQQTHTAGWAET